MMLYLKGRNGSWQLDAELHFVHLDFLLIFMLTSSDLWTFMLIFIIDLHVELRDDLHVDFTGTRKYAGRKRL